VVLGLQVRNLTRHADDPASVRGTAVTLQQGMSDLLDDFRTLVHGIMPASLADRGIESAIRDLGERTAVPLVLRSSGLGRRLPQAIESTVYFVVLESVTNAVKHAAASGIWVELVQVDGLLCAAVRDDGHGGAALGGGSGLEGLRDRVLALNGSLTVSSAPGTGTEVKALIPCG
jgi:signal transduction histidine kinase